MQDAFARVRPRPKGKRDDRVSCIGPSTKCEGREWFGNFEGGIIYENSKKMKFSQGSLVQTRRHNILKFQYGYYV